MLRGRNRDGRQVVSGSGSKPRPIPSPRIPAFRILVHRHPLLVSVTGVGPVLVRGLGGQFIHFVQNTMSSRF